MKATDLADAFPSVLINFRRVPLVKMAEMDDVTLDGVLDRVLPDPQATPSVRVAAFSSSV